MEPPRGIRGGGGGRKCRRAVYGWVSPFGVYDYVSFGTSSLQHRHPIFRVLLAVWLELELCRVWAKRASALPVQCMRSPIKQRLSRATRCARRKVGVGHTIDSIHAYTSTAVGTGNVLVGLFSVRSDGKAIIVKSLLRRPFMLSLGHAHCPRADGERAATVLMRGVRIMSSLGYQSRPL